MGLLDDAIREHLDLKRRRGADAAEVERAERDALGPVRRVAEESHPDDGELDEVDPGHQPEPDAEPEYEDEEWEEHEVEPDPRPTVVGRDESLDHGEDTAEYDVEREQEKDRPHGKEGKKNDDVLEETPDFLQDTPDHDRLWFEQRPPRDFDFDG